MLKLRFQRISGLEVQLAADAVGENDLSFGGKLGLHCKTILPWQSLKIEEKLVGLD
jgi:hypothetical protein